MEGVASDLAQVGKQHGAAVVVDDNAGVVPKGVAVALEVGAEEGVFAGPEVFAETSDGVKGFFADKEVATREVFNATEGALDKVAITEVAGDEGGGEDGSGELGIGWIVGGR